MAMIARIKRLQASTQQLLASGRKLSEDELDVVMTFMEQQGALLVTLLGGETPTTSASPPMAAPPAQQQQHQHQHQHQHQQAPQQAQQQPKKKSNEASSTKHPHTTAQQQQQQPTQKPKQQQGQQQQRKGPAATAPQQGSGWVTMARKPPVPPPPALAAPPAASIAATQIGVAPRGLLFAQQAKRAKELLELAQAAVAEDSQRAYAVICGTRFAGASEEMLTLVGGMVRPLWVATAGNIPFNSGVPAGSDGVPGVAHVDAVPRGEERTRVLVFCVAAAHTSKDTWTALTTGTDSLTVLQGLARRAASDAGKVRVRPEQVWRPQWRKGRVDAMVRVPREAVTSLLQASGAGGCFWKELQFAGGREPYAAIPLCKGTTLSEARAAAKGLGPAALGLVYGVRTLSVRVATPQQAEAVRANLGDKAEPARDPLMKWVVSGARGQEHADDILFDLRRAGNGWNASVINSRAKSGQRVLVVTAPTPPPFSCITRAGRPSLWVREWAKEDAPPQDVRRFKPAPAAGPPAKVKLPERYVSSPPTTPIAPPQVSPQAPPQDPPPPPQAPPAAAQAEPAADETAAPPPAAGGGDDVDDESSADMLSADGEDGAPRADANGKRRRVVSGGDGAEEEDDIDEMLGQPSSKGWGERISSAVSDAMDYVSPIRKRNVSIHIHQWGVGYKATMNTRCQLCEAVVGRQYTLKSCEGCNQVACASCANLHK